MQLLDALRARGNVASVWSAEDFDFIDEDNATAHLDDAQLATLKQSLLDDFGSGLMDVLAQRGNSYLAQRWEDQKEEMLAKQAESETQRQR